MPPRADKMEDPQSSDTLEEWQEVHETKQDAEILHGHEEQDKPGEFYASIQFNGNNDSETDEDTTDVTISDDMEKMYESTFSIGSGFMGEIDESSLIANEESPEDSYGSSQSPYSDGQDPDQSNLSDGRYPRLQDMFSGITATPVRPSAIPHRLEHTNGDDDDDDDTDDGSDDEADDKAFDQLDQDVAQLDATTAHLYEDNAEKNRLLVNLRKELAETKASLASEIASRQALQNISHKAPDHLSNQVVVSARKFSATRTILDLQDMPCELQHNIQPERSPRKRIRNRVLLLALMWVVVSNVPMDEEWVTWGAHHILNTFPTRFNINYTCALYFLGGFPWFGVLLGMLLTL